MIRDAFIGNERTRDESGKGLFMMYDMAFKEETGGGALGAFDIDEPITE